MKTITLKNREYTIEATGLNVIAYKLHSGKLELTGYRNQNDKDLILVVDKSNRIIGSFLESAMRRVELI